MEKILLNRNKGVDSVNVDNSIPVELSTKNSLLPGSSVEGTINQYQIYLNERNNTERYKMLFTIHPYMSNILYNNFTEIVANEGGVNSFILTNSPLETTGPWYYNAARKTPTTVNAVANTGLTRFDAIRDTEYSHPDIGNFSYNCGLDIFNNHYLRSKGYFSVRKANDDKNLGVFNTIEDLLVYGNGVVATHNRETPYSTPTTQIEGIHTHLFNHENLLSFHAAFVENFKEDNGWVGFTNKTYSNMPNHSIIENGIVKEVTINKCINNRNGCDFIDLYPDRSLFSFLPKVNTNYNNRVEYNWEWFITYPCEKVVNNGENGSFIFFNENGLKLMFIEHQDKFLVQNFPHVSENSVSRERVFVYFRTISSHGLSSGDLVKVTYGDKSFSCRVVSIGNENGDYKKYYFSLRYDDLSNEFGESSLIYGAYRMNYITLPSSMYVSKIVNGIPCQYYIRKFKKIDGLKSNISKAGFSKTIYNDPVSQIIFSDDVNVSGLRNHLGFKLDEVFLTIIKRNKGFKEWVSGVTSPAFVEASHCFGPIKSGFNFEYSKDEGLSSYLLSNFKYNIRKIGISENEPFLDKQDTGNWDSQTFFGDFVEFSESMLEERVLEDVYHRFNTTQRELGGVDGIYDVLQEEVLVYDDFDFNDTMKEKVDENGIAFFTVEKRDVKTGDKHYIEPEGYFYKPHYRVKLKEYDTHVHYVYDKKVNVVNKKIYKDDEELFGYYFVTDIDYKIRCGDVILLYYGNGEYREFFASHKTDSKKVYFNANMLLDIKHMNPQKVFIKNFNAPEDSYYIANGSGKRLWRNVIPETEILQTSDIYNRTYANGSIYINTGINFYLRRQDPQGEYGLRDGGLGVKYSINGLNTILPDIEYKTTIDYNTCEV